MAVLKDSFQGYFQRAAAASQDTGSTQSSGSNRSTTVSTQGSLDRRPGGRNTTLQRTPSDFGEYLSGQPPRGIRPPSLADLDIGGSVRLSERGDFSAESAQNVTQDTGFSEPDSGMF